jgi:hypothetical protein
MEAFNYRPVQLGRELCYIPGKTEKEEEVKRVSAQDWENFLHARSAEMKKGEHKMFVIFIICIYFSHMYGFQFDMPAQYISVP